MIEITLEMPGETAPRVVRGEGEAVSVARGLYHSANSSATALRDARLRLGWFLLQVKGQLPRREFGAFCQRLAANGNTIKSAMAEATKADENALDGAVGVSRRTQQKAMRIARAFPEQAEEVAKTNTCSFSDETLADLEVAAGARTLGRRMRAALGKTGVPAEREGPAGTCPNEARGDTDRVADRQTDIEPLAGDVVVVGKARLLETGGGVMPTTFTVGEQLSMSALYERVDRTWAALGEVRDHWDDIDESIRRQIADACSLIDDKLSLSSCRAAADMR